MKLAHKERVQNNRAQSCEFSEDLHGREKSKFLNIAYCSIHDEQGSVLVNP